jgi:hypothetical protein
VTRTEKMWAWIGGLIAGTAAIGGIAYAASSKPSTAPVTPSTPTATTSLNPSVAYVFSAKVPSGVNDPTTLANQLSAIGWTDVVIAYFGPTGALVPNFKNPFTVDSSTYVAAGTWTGAANSPIPAGVSVLAAASL